MVTLGITNSTSVCAEDTFDVLFGVLRVQRSIREESCWTDAVKGQASAALDGVFEDSVLDRLTQKLSFVLTLTSSQGGI